MKNKYFGIRRFAEWADLNEDYDIWRFGIMRMKYRGLFDHGFIAARAPVWSDGALDGSEIAIISRTYCSDNEIDNPPDGLRCWRLPKVVVGENEPGTAIATVIVRPTKAANDFLTLCGRLPSDMMPYAISQKMCRQGYAIILQTDGWNGIFASISQVTKR